MVVEGIDCLVFFVCANDYYAYVRILIGFYGYGIFSGVITAVRICRPCSILFFLFRVACTDRLIRGNAERPQGVMSCHVVAMALTVPLWSDSLGCPHNHR